MSFPRYPKYKDSGVEWLGEVPEHWDVKPLKRCFTIVGGSTPASGDESLWDGDIPWATPSDLSALESLYVETTQRTITTSGLQSCGTTLVPAGTVILSTRAPIGSLGIAATELCTNQGCKSLVPHPTADPKYFAYLLSVSTDQLVVRGKGTTFLELSGSELGSFVVPVPDTNTQRLIASFLDRETAKIDSLISEQQRLVELLQEKRQAVISHAVTKGLNPDVPMKDSGIEWLGEVPEHWEVSRFKWSVAKSRNGLWGDEANGDDNDVPCVRVADFDRQQLRVAPEVPTIRNVSPSESAGRLLARGNLLLEKSGGGESQPVGCVVLYDNTSKAICSNFIARIELTDGMDPSFCRYLHAAAYKVRLNTRSIKQTSGIQNLDQQQYLDERGAFPPSAEQKAISTFLEQETNKVDSLIAEAERAITLLQERRSALISAAVTGQIDVRGLAGSEAA